MLNLYNNLCNKIYTYILNIKFEQCFPTQRLSIKSQLWRVLCYKGKYSVTVNLTNLALSFAK